MATHSSILAWRTSWTEEPGRLQPQANRVRHESTHTRAEKGYPRKGWTWRNSSSTLDTDLLGEGAAPLTVAHFAGLLDCLTWFTVDKLQVTGQADKWGIPQPGNLEAEPGRKEISCQRVGRESWRNSTGNCLVERAVELMGNWLGHDWTHWEAARKLRLWAGPGEAGWGTHGTCWVRSIAGTNTRRRSRTRKPTGARKRGLFVLQGLSAPSTGRV